MKLTAEKTLEIYVALLAKLPEQKLGPCPICSTTQWALAEAFFLIPDSTEMSLSEGNISKASRDRTLPAVALYCTNCGNTHFLSLKVLGLERLIREPASPPNEETQPAPK